MDSEKSVGAKGYWSASNIVQNLEWTPYVLMVLQLAFSWASLQKIGGRSVL